ncbi:MAG: tetratricopeptide repeat protein [Xanthomonadales bacterium]|nr:tetratricopeptide repeat protein [Xanthomonadales bacterium]
MSFFNELKRRNVFRVGIAYTVATWLLIQVTDIVFPRIGLPDSAVTLVIALLAIGFIPAIIFAWAFEMTADGIKREKEVDRSQSITPKTARKLDRMIILALALVVVWFVADEYYFEPQQAAVVSLTTPEAGPDDSSSTDLTQSIAVLPFVNMSADVENEYFSDGISEELLNVLVKVSALRVASRTSSFTYKGSDLSITEIAREMNVDHILEGSVRKAGNRVRITAQLINTETDRHIWSETYERELVDIFDIQEEISNNIVAALKVALNVDETAAISRAQRPTENPEAYELYLQGRFAWRQRHEENILKSIELFEKAIALDPEFARAYEALASAWVVLPAWSNQSNSETSEYAKPNAIRALELDPTLSEARAILAEITLDEHRWAEAMDQYQKAIKDDPRDPTLHQWLAEALMSMGFLKQGLEQLQVAYELDPASPVINQSMSWAASVNRKDDLALKHIGIAKGLGVGNRAVSAAADSLVRKGQTGEILSALDDLEVPLPTERLCVEAIGDPSLKEQLFPLLDQYLVDPDPDEYLYWVVMCLALADQPDRAAELARTGIEDSWGRLNVFWSSNPQAGAMRQTQVFKDLLKDMGLLDYYREYGWPDLCHPLGDDDFECAP